MNTPGSMKLVICVLTMVVHCLNVVETCSCFPSHPQELFCNSDFVIKALVTSEARKVKTNNPFFFMKSQSLTILETFRGKEALYRLLRNKGSIGGMIPKKLEFVEANITTPSSESLCGIHLNFTGSYLLFGQIRNNELQVNMCNYIANWETVTDQVKSGIYGGYDCRCNIETRMTPQEKENQVSGDLQLKEHGNKVEKKPSYTCYWEMYPDEPVDECALNFLTCRKLVHAMSVNDEMEECVWVEGKEYESCRRSSAVNDNDHP